MDQINNSLVQKIKGWADRSHLLQPGTAVVLGFSGGADSVCLLHVLKVLAKLRHFSIFAVHINHMLRGAESDGDESFVREVCKSWHIPLWVFREDIIMYSKEKGCSIEEAGRIIRYERFYQVMEETGSQYIAVAHHSQDQAETVFLNLLRGSGLDGLCGMGDISERIIRPFLNIDKEEILGYISENRLEYRVDSSNLDNCYARNSIRNTVFPMIQRETGFQVTRSLLRSVKLLKEDRDYLRQLAEQAYKNIVLSTDKNRVVLDRKKLNSCHRSISSRIIRLVWQELTGSTTGLEERHVGCSLALSEKKATGKMINLPKGIIVNAEYGKLIMEKQQMKQPLKRFSVPMPVPSTVNVPEAHIRLTAGLYTKEQYIEEFVSIEKNKETGLTQLFDYDRVNEGINIRNRRPGDVFFPYGSLGSKKLKDFFIDKKIPRDKREGIPLLADGKNIIWVIGMRTAENYKITENTGTILHVEVTEQVHF